MEAECQMGSFECKVYIDTVTPYDLIDLLAINICIERSLQLCKRTKLSNENIIIACKILFLIELCQGGWWQQTDNVFYCSQNRAHAQ